MTTGSLRVLTLALTALLTAPAMAADRLAVIPFTGPNTTSIDPDIIWKHKTGLSAPSPEELKPLPVKLSEAVTAKLAAKLGKLAVTGDELKGALDEMGLSGSADKAKRNQELAKRLDVAYVLDGNVDRMEFDGNTVVADKYVMFITAGLKGTSGDAAALWSVTNKKYYKKIKATKGRAIATVFTEEQIPEIAESISADVVKALGR